MYDIPAKKLEFVNVNLDKDNKIFLDPLKIKRSKTEFGKKCYNKIEEFINNLLNLAKNRNYKELLKIIDNLYERNETRLGYSINSSLGKSFGENGGKNLVQSLANNKMIINGKVEDIFDCLMIVPNIGEDKVSDLITSIIFMDLIEYTQKQCNMLKIPLEKVKIKKLCWNHQESNWIKLNTELPIFEKKPIVFVPKEFAGIQYIFSYEQLYRDVIIPLYKEREKKTPGSKYIIKFKSRKKTCFRKRTKEGISMY